MKVLVHCLHCRKPFIVSALSPEALKADLKHTYNCHEGQHPMQQGAVGVWVVVGDATQEENRRYAYAVLFGRRRDPSNSPPYDTNELLRLWAAIERSSPIPTS